jgi:hypothetical protein
LLRVLARKLHFLSVVKVGWQFIILSLWILPATTRGNSCPPPVDPLALIVQKIKVEGYAFDEKFRRQKDISDGTIPPFKSGEIIKSIFLLNFEGDLPVLLIPEATGGVGDIRSADKFFLEVKDEKELSTLRKLQGYVFSANVQITGKGKYLASNMFSYPAKFFDEAQSVPMNPSTSLIQQMQYGIPFGLEGIVTEIKPLEIAIRTTDDQDRVIHVTGDQSYEGDADSGIDTIAQKPIEVGDKVRVNASAANGTIAASTVRSFWLMQPNEQRLKKYNDERTRIAPILKTMREAIVEKNYSIARIASSKIAKSELSKSENMEWRKLAESMPRWEQPVYASDRFNIDKLNTNYEIDFDTFSIREFTKFVQEWAQGAHTAKTPTDETYLVTLLQDQKLDDKIIAEIYQNNVFTRLKYFEKQSDAGIAYNHDLHWNQYYNYLQGSRLAAIHPVDGTTQLVLAMAENILTNDENNWTFKGKFALPTFQTLDELYVSAVEDRKTREDLLAQLPRLEKIRARAAELARQKVRAYEVILGPLDEVVGGLRRIKNPPVKMLIAK